MARISIVRPCLKECSHRASAAPFIGLFVYNLVLTSLSKLGFLNFLDEINFIRRQMRYYRLSNTAAKFGVLIFPNGCENAGQVEKCLLASPACEPFLPVGVAICAAMGLFCFSAPTKYVDVRSTPRLALTTRY